MGRSGCTGQHAPFRGQAGEKAVETLDRRTIMKFVRMLVIASLTVMLIMANAHPASAQSGAGSIQGTVQDATHAVISGASIHVINTATGVVSTTTSNKVGFYQVPGLFTGRYRVTVTTPGMKTYTTLIDLLVSQDAVINPVMTPGSVTQHVVVRGDAVQLVTTDNGTISDTLENARINQLPENGRNVMTLVQMATPGLAGAGQSAVGLQPEAMAYTVDGVATMNAREGGEFYHGQQLLDPDSVQEVRMSTVDTGANYGTPAGVMVSTKSGTNALHGTFFWTTRNNAFGIAKSRQDPSNFSAPKYIRNEEGGSVGGPIVLPHLYHGKNKSFFFFAYERYSLAQNGAFLSRVPTPVMRQGDFSGLINGAGILQTLYDPATTASSSKCAANKKANPYCRTPFPSNQIPLAEESPLAKIYYQLLPAPTSTANPLVAPNLDSLIPELQLTPQETFRLDQAFNGNNHAYLRYTQNLSDTSISAVGGLRTLAAGGIPAGAAGGFTTGPRNLPAHNYLTAIGYTHIFSPTFFSETIASQQWFYQAQQPGAAAVAPNINYEAMLGLPNNFGALGFPSIGSNLFYNLGSSQTSNSSQSQIVSTLDENLTKVLGRHQLLFGGRFQHVRLADQSIGLADGVGFNGSPTAVYNPATGASYGTLPNTGNQNASLFLGSASSYNVDQEPPIGHYHLMEFDGYIQDNYHVSRNLTLNLGLRYEAHPATWTKYGLANSFDLKNDALVLAVPPSTLIAEGFATPYVFSNLSAIGAKIETPSQAGMPANTLVRNYNLNFLPRAGIAYQLFGGKYGTVIRGGYGRYIAPVPITEYLESFLNRVPLAYGITQDYTSAAQAIDGLPNELVRYNDPVKFGVAGRNTANVVNTTTGTTILPGIGAASDSPNQPPEFLTETNLTLEQALKGNSALRVSWIWSHSTNLPTSNSYNHHPSAYQWEMATGTLPPTGGYSVIGTPQQNTYAATATGPYDQTTWGGNTLGGRNGWSNDNQLQVDYQRLFHHGVAYQIWYTFSKPMRFGGKLPVNDQVYPDANYPGILGTVATMTPAYGPVYPGVAPPARPAGLPNWAEWHAMDKYQAYQLDSEDPIHQIGFNGIIDLPFGRGKRFFSGFNGFWNEVIGGFQLAGYGNVTSQSFTLTANLEGPASAIHIYKHRHPITDCRSGTCYKAFLWFNGYLAPTATTGVAGSVCTKNCVSGLPADYQPYQTPVDNDPTSQYYGTNDVLVTLSNGTQNTVPYDVGPAGGDYLAKSQFAGPFDYSADISLFKVFPIHEQMNLRFNVDAFNAFNVQGYVNPGADGVEQVQPGVTSSKNAPRQIQLTMRFTF